MRMSLYCRPKYIRKVVEDVGEDEEFKGGSWVSAIEFVNASGGGIVNGCLRDIENYLNGKLEQVVAIIKSCTPNALGDLTVTLKDLSDTIPFPGNGSGVCGNVTNQEDQYKLDEEALDLALEEETRSKHEWLEKCRQEQEIDEEHERQLWGFYSANHIQTPPLSNANVTLESQTANAKWFKLHCIGMEMHQGFLDLLFLGAEVGALEPLGALKPSTHLVMAIFVYLLGAEVEAACALEVKVEATYLVGALDLVGLSLNIIISALVSGYLTSLNKTRSSSPKTKVAKIVNR
ncbi:hypothetical protein Tco_0005221 [Tanacetum coccineum]